MAMNKKEKIICEQKFTNYKKYAEAEQIYCPPTQGVNSGAHGRLLELTVKRDLGIAFKTVSGAYRPDCLIKIGGQWQTIEVKTGSGELARVNPNGSLTAETRRKDWVVYSPQYDGEYSPVYVMTGEQFYNGLNAIGLIRFKKSRNYIPIDDASDDYKRGDRLAIQSFRNSAKKETAWVEWLEENAIRYNEWLESIGRNK